MKKRFILLCMMVAAMACSIMSCEKDSDSSITDIDVTRISVEDSIKAAVTDSINNRSRLDSVDVSFTLLNPDGKETTTFAYGENITFQVTIFNRSTQNVRLTTAYPLIGGEEAFMVYTKEGEQIGRPWDVLATPAVYPEPVYSVNPDKPLFWSCKWKENYYSESDPYINDPSFVLYRPFYLIQEKERDNLAKGSYYSKFTVCLGSNIYVECRKDFVVE